ncbi:hypothetical protein M059_09135 [Streptococcus mitis 18/56]|uniref:Uncharacterized protein n=1 Tax=Streptococcus mitis 18/56 TaxID=1340485 RepID=S7YP04_STRMT|nr:hypothetical protein M059_09135 [Streptococcus mitis 18/56]
MQKMGLSVTHSDNKINIKHNNRSLKKKNGDTRPIAI